MSSSATPAGAASPDAGGDGVSKMAKDSQKAAAALDAITDHVRACRSLGVHGRTRALAGGPLTDVARG